MEIAHYRFSELSLMLLHDIMKLRQEVFVVEQDCPYLDVDGLDTDSIHVIGLGKDGGITTYLRIIPECEGRSAYVIGRVVTSTLYRGRGLGRTLMLYAIDLIRDLCIECDIVLSAQVYARAFYESLGFEAEGSSYLEDGIEHISMRLTRQF